MSDKDMVTFDEYGIAQVHDPGLLRVVSGAEPAQVNAICASSTTSTGAALNGMCTYGNEYTGGVGVNGQCGRGNWSDNEPYIFVGVNGSCPGGNLGCLAGANVLC